jgi:hypothetical protein
VPTTVITIATHPETGEVDCATVYVRGGDVDVGFDVGFDVTDVTLVTVLGHNAVDNVVVMVAI